jgi:predicted  nucleic acid-binding Zn-ribbon protein
MLLFIYRSIELLRKARDELAHHHSQLVQVSHKYERSVFKNSKLEDSVSATKRELEEFKRKDAENAKAIKQVIPFLSSQWSRCCLTWSLLGPIYGT